MNGTTLSAKCTHQQIQSPQLNVNFNKLSYNADQSANVMVCTVSVAKATKGTRLPVAQGCEQ